MSKICSWCKQRTTFEKNYCEWCGNGNPELLRKEVKIAIRPHDWIAPFILTIALAGLTLVTLGRNLNNIFGLIFLLGFLGVFAYWIYVFSTTILLYQNGIEFVQYYHFPMLEKKRSYIFGKNGNILRLELEHMEIGKEKQLRITIIDKLLQVHHFGATKNRDFISNFILEMGVKNDMVKAASGTQQPTLIVLELPKEDQ